MARRTNVVARARKSKHAYLYLLPASLGMVVVVFVPFLVGGAVSLFTHKGGEFTFVGLKNFVSILQSSDYPVTDPMSFWFTLVVTVLWTVLNVTLHTTIGLGLALLLRDPWMKLKGLYRVLLIVPWAVPNYITALIWKGMFNRQFGAVNGVLDVFGFQPVSWFSNFFTAFAANLTTNTWLGFPFMMVVTLGALQAIPRDLTEAAEVDGASAWERFRHITLPLLRPALLPAVILGSVWTFNMFNIIYLVSAGEPGGGTEILISEAYKWAFTRQAQYGYASAYSLLIFGILILYTLATKKVTEVSI
jgi:arabinogalactan oligomer/maltooligosaccharide transport system permease protein